MNPSQRPATAAAVVLALAAAMPAWAATTVVSVQVDTAAIVETSAGFFSVQDAPPFTPLAPFSLEVGDTLDYTVRFTGGQSLTVTEPGAFWAYIYSDNAAGAQQTTGTGTLELLDTSGGVLYTSQSLTSTEGDSHFGQYFSVSLFPGLPSTVVIGGARYVGTVEGYAPTKPGTDPVITSRGYGSPAFAFTAAVPAVPEPSSALALLIGLGVLAGVAARRRR